LNPTFVSDLILPKMASVLSGCRSVHPSTHCSANHFGFTIPGDKGQSASPIIIDNSVLSELL
jgi:hypothetical protein